MDPVVTGQLARASAARHVSDFLTDLSNTNASAHTLRAYRGDLLQFAAYHDSEVGELTVATVRAYLADIAGLAASSRKRKRAAVASFCRWAVRHDLLHANPMDKIDTIRVPKRPPRPAGRGDLPGRGSRVLEEFSVGGDLPTGRPGPSSLTPQKANGYMR